VRTRRLISIISVSVLALGAYAIASDSPHHKNRFETTLQGFQENPSLSTTGRGHVDLKIDDDAQTITFELTYDRLEGVGTTPFVTDGVVTQSHIHVSAKHVNGGVAVFFCGGGGKPACPTPSGSVSGVIVPGDIVGPAAQGINPGEATAFRELVKAIRAGFAYANVHTTRWPAGEIRGQLVESDDRH
jgi:CHRD domain